jgi:hypothetical protein
MKDEKETTEEKEKKREREILLYIPASSRSATLDSSYILYEGTFFFLHELPQQPGALSSLIDTEYMQSQYTTHTRTRYNTHVQWNIVCVLCIRFSVSKESPYSRV